MATSTDRVRRFRERQAAKLEAAPDAPPRDPGDLLLPAVEASLAALRLGEQHGAAVLVARRLAATIDEAQDPAAALRVYGSQLLRALEALGATPASRAAVPAAPKRAPSALDELRAARARRSGA